MDFGSSKSIKAVVVIQTWITYNAAWKVTFGDSNVATENKTFSFPIGTYDGKEILVESSGRYLTIITTDS